MSRGSLVMNYSWVKTAPFVVSSFLQSSLTSTAQRFSVQVVDDVGYSLSLSPMPGKKICRFWDFPCISVGSTQNHVKFWFRVQFPLNDNCIIIYTDYHYTTREAMEEAIKKGEFIETAEFSGNFYGTRYEFIVKDWLVISNYGLRPKREKKITLHLTRKSQ